MKSRFNFTQELVKKASCPVGKKQVRFMDTRTENLGLRVTPAGSKMFIYYRCLPKDNESPGKVCELKIGKVDDLTIEQARRQATEWNQLVGEKKDPSLNKTDDGLTYSSLFQLYIDQYAKLHTNTWQDTIENNRRYFARWQNKPVAKIRRINVQAWINELAEHGKHKHTANRNYDTMRAVLSWGLRKDYFSGDNPCIGVDRFKTKSRERFIQPGDEFLRFATAVDEEPNETIRDFVWMALFTGQRRANVLAMEWNQIEWELTTWRIPVTKNGDSQNVPLTPSAMQILKQRKASPEAHERWVFPSDRRGRISGVVGHLTAPKNAWAKILERAGIEDLRIHDLRRTAGSIMAIQGVSTTIIGKDLGHRSPQATAIYARLTQDPVRQAFENAQAALLKPEKLVRQKAEIVNLERVNDQG